MGPDAIIFDGDDTLWLVEPLYDAARKEAADVVASSDLDPRRWEQLEREIDVKNVERFGVTAQRFPTSCIEAYQALSIESKRPAALEIQQAIWKAANQVFSRRALMIEGAADIVASVRQTSRVALITKGERWVQEKRIQDAGMEDSFDRIAIVPEKGPSEFEASLAALHANASRSWSIGNSLASDINPALSIGMSAIWIDAHVWEHERRELAVAPGHHFVVDSLRDVPKLIAGQANETWTRAS